VRIVGLLASLMSASLAGCLGPASQDRTGYVASIRPVNLIVSEVAEPVTTLVPPGQSPHTFSPRPSDAKAVAGARALFYAAEALDGWATRLAATTPIELLPLVPEKSRWATATGDDHGHDHGEWDPHFWSDPIAVQTMLPGLAAALERIDKENAATYQANAKRFATELAALDTEVRALIGGIGYKPVALLHAGWGAFFARYNLLVAGYIEPDPGKAMSPAGWAALLKTLEGAGVVAIFGEVGLSNELASEAADELGIDTVAELDPLGSACDCNDYAALVRYNANVIRRALL